jgi:hypothetical protein
VEVLPLLYSYKSVVKILISHLFITDMPKESKEPNKEPKKSKRKGGRKGITYKDKALPYEHVLVKEPKAKRGQKPVYTTRVGEQRPLTRDELRQQELIQARAIQGQQALQAQQRQEGLANLQLEYLKQKIAQQQEVVIPPKTVSVEGKTVTKPTYAQYIEARKILAKNPPEIKRLSKEFMEQSSAYESDLSRGVFNDEASKSLIEKENNLQKLALERDEALNTMNEYTKYHDALTLKRTLDREKAEQERLKREQERKLAEEEAKEQRFEMSQRSLENLFSEKENKKLAEQRKIDESRRLQEEALQQKLSSQYVWVADPDTGIMSPVRVVPQKIRPIQSDEMKQFQEEQKMREEEQYGEFLRQVEKRNPMETGEPYTKTREQELIEKFEKLNEPSEEEIFPPFSLRKPIFERPETKPVASYGGGGGEPGTRRKRREKEIPLSFQPEPDVTLSEQSQILYTPPPPVPLLPDQPRYNFEPPAPSPGPVRIRKEKTPLPISFQPEPIAPIVPEQAMVPYSPPVTELVAREVRKPYKWTGKRGVGPLSEVLPLLPPPPSQQQSTELILPYETDLSGLLGKREALTSVRRQAARSNKYNKSAPVEEVTAPAPLMLTEPPPPNPFAPLPPFTSSTALYAQPSPEWINFASQSSYSDIPVWTPGASVGESFNYRSMFDI